MKKTIFHQVEDVFCNPSIQNTAKGSEVCVSTSIDAVILLVIVNVTRTRITVCSQDLIFTLEQSMFRKLKSTYFAAIHRSL